MLSHTGDEAPPSLCRQARATAWGPITRATCKGAQFLHLYECVHFFRRRGTASLMPKAFGGGGRLALLGWRRGVLRTTTHTRLSCYVGCYGHHISTFAGHTNRRWTTRAPLDARPRSVRRRVPGPRGASPPVLRSQVPEQGGLGSAAACLSAA